MIKLAAPLLALLVLFAVPPAVAQAPAGPAEALAWRSVQACVAISRGATVAKAATEAGYRQHGETWIAAAGERGFTLEIKPFPPVPNGMACILVVRGPLADHAGFGERLADWAIKDGYAAMGTSDSPSGARMEKFGAASPVRLLILARYPETGKPEQPARTSVFVGWQGP